MFFYDKIPRALIPAKTILMTMKLVAIIMAVCIVQVSAASYAQRITLKQKNAPLSRVIEQLRRQSGYDFLFDSKLIGSAKQVTVDLNNTTLEEALDRIFEIQPLIYSVKDKFVVLERKPLSLLDRMVTALQDIDVRGTVVDESGKPLPGATVRSKNRGHLAKTDVNGDFLLQNVDEQDSLIVSYLGYSTRIISVSANTGTIQLQLNVESLSEVVVNTGYQRLLKERAPGSFSQVTQETLSRRPVANLSTALQGLVAGMQGKENADGSVSFLIRGNTSLYADRNPLVVVDGMPVSSSDFSNLNPNDVENVTVLKDAAAASIWGARAANGVIVITTKRAKAGTGLNIEGTAFTRVSNRPDLNQLLLTANSADHIAYERRAFENGWFFQPYAGGFPSDFSKTLTLAQELLFANKNGKLSAADMNRQLDSLGTISNQAQLQENLLRRAVLSQYNVNLSHSSERSRSYGSLLFEDNKSRFHGSAHKRYGINFNNEYQLAKFLKFNFAVYLQHQDQQSSGAKVQEIAQLSPYETLLNGDGSYSPNLLGFNRELVAALPLNKFPYSDLSYNLLRETRGREFSTKDYSARIQTGFNIKLLEGLDIDTRVQYERQKTDVSNFYSDDTYYVRSMVDTYLEYNNSTKTIGRMFLPKGGILQSNVADVANYVFRNQLNFNKTLGEKHSINAIAGVEISQSRTDTKVNPWLYGYQTDRLQATVPVYGYGSSADQFTTITGGSSTLNGGVTTLGYNLYRYVSYYSNAAYTYDGKYTLSGSVRFDASNFITEIPSLRWEPLWSAGALWNVKAESFAQDMNWIDRLSLRATYGRNGNVERSTSTSALLNVSTAPNANTGTITATVADNGNPTLRWEKTSTVNLGLDFTLFRGKLSGKADAYAKTGSDITGLIALPYAVGTGSQRFNNAGITNRGIEMELATTFKVPSLPLVLSSALNYAYNENKVTDLYYPSLLANALLGLNNTQVFVEGRPVNPLYSFNYGGMKDGVPQIIGPGGQPASMSSTATLVSNVPFQFLNYEGTTTPPHTLGWSNSVRLNNLTFSVLFIGKMGGVYRNPTFNYGNAYVGSAKTVVNRFVSDVIAGRPDIPDFPKQNEVNQYMWTNYINNLSGLVERSSYIECKEMMVDYQLPASVLKRGGINNLRIYAQARDLGLVWAANKNNYNPDWLPGTDRPLTSFTFGLAFNY